MPAVVRYRWLWLVTILVGIGAGGAWLAVRQPVPLEAAGQGGQPQGKPGAAQPGSREVEQAVRKAGAAYIEAMNKQDLDAVLAFWATDADFVNESGEMTRGKDAIAALFKKVLPNLKGTKIKGAVHAIKVLRPDVVLEDGSLEFTSADGSGEVGRYAVIWTRTGDRWQIASARDLPSEVAEQPSLAYPHLKSFEWLIGEWQDDGAKADVHLTCRWAPNKTFLLMEYTVKREGQDEMQVSQRVGWDPLNEAVRSWVFDSLGGFGEGTWRREGNRWITETSGVLPDGSSGGATIHWQPVDAKTFIWRSLDREVDGQPVPDVEIKLIRKAAK